MRLITLTTDWYKNDYYNAAIHGYILGRCPDVKIVEITNSINTFNTSQTAFVIRNSYRFYPAGTIHIISVGSDNSTSGAHLVANCENQYFICADNGILSLALQSAPVKVIKLADDKVSSFPELNNMAAAACAIHAGAELDELGQPVQEMATFTPLRPLVDKNVITGNVIYIDSFDNVITNISKKLFEKTGNGKKYAIYVNSNHYKIEKLNDGYDQTTPGELLALFNAADLLEIAINKGRVASLLSLDTNSKIRIKFKE